VGGGCGLVLAALLVPAGAAHGAVVQLRPGPGSPPVVSDLQVTGLPGESNLVTIAPGSGGVLVVRDTGARLVPGENCASVDAATVTCSRSGAPTELQLWIATSDGDDRIAVDGALPYRYGFLSGGTGDDVVLGGRAWDDVSGDAGDDRLDGGAGDDELRGRTGADVMRGGPGVDEVAYGSGAGPVTVTLDGRPGDGAAGEGDDVGLDVENLTGGEERDRFVGSDASNELDGGEGVNELVGGAGGDRLLGGEGHGGRLVGGPGRDRVEPPAGATVDVRDGETDRVDCDDGLRRPLRADRGDALRGCAPSVGLRGLSAPVGRHGRVRLGVRCDAVGQPCRARLELRRGGALVARATLRLRRGQRRTLVRLDHRGRRLLRTHRTLPVTARLRPFRETPAPSRGHPADTSLTLRRA
jgi:RTX calcium-binding nonapeptide repeat (4 copies)